MGEQSKAARFWNGLCNFCRRVTDRKFMASFVAIVGVFCVNLDPQIAAIIAASVASAFTVMKGLVEITERWKDVKIEEVKAKNGGSE